MAALQSPPHSPAHSHTIITVAHDAIPPSASFLASLQRVMNSPPATPAGLEVIPRSSAQPSVPGLSIRLDEIPHKSLPSIPAAELPLPLDDARRVYASRVPGVRLTHPGGWLEGGVGPSGLTPAAPSDGSSRGGVGGGGSVAGKAWVKKHGIKSREQLERVLEKERKALEEELRKRMKERKEAAEHNARTEREIEKLKADRNMERHIEAKLRKARRESQAQG